MKILLLLLCISLLCHSSFAQQDHWFAKDVATIKEYDKIYEHVAHPIVFTGSSSIRKWERLPVVFGNYNVLNRGIGGAVIDDIHYFLNELVFSYKPRQVVLYIGDNDLPNEEKTADTIAQKTIRLIQEIREGLPGVPIVYLSIKPSPSREKYMGKATIANSIIRTYLITLPQSTYVDVATPMIKDGKPDSSLFVKDRLHMNATGYKIWEDALAPYLLPL